MNDVVESELWRKIPLDVFINHIMPYVYKKQDVELLDDIRNFVFVYHLIVDYYFYGLNEYCLLVDLTFFCNGGVSLMDGVYKCFIDILNRNTAFRELPPDVQYHSLNEQFYFNVGFNTQNKNKSLLALLTPSERARFINEFLIVDGDGDGDADGHDE